jgi:hypothetical protein
VNLDPSPYNPVWWIAVAAVVYGAVAVWLACCVVRRRRRQWRVLRDGLAGAICLGCPRCEGAQPEADCNCLGDCGRRDCGRRPATKETR